MKSQIWKLLVTNLDFNIFSLSLFFFFLSVVHIVILPASGLLNLEYDPSNQEPFWLPSNPVAPHFIDYWLLIGDLWQPRHSRGMQDRKNSCSSYIYNPTGVTTLTVHLSISILPLLPLGQRGIVVGCVCPSVRPFGHPSIRSSLYKFYLVRMITYHRFQLVSPNLHQTFILGYSQLLLKTGALTTTLNIILALLTQEFLEIQLAHMITCNGFELESPNLHQICILGFSWLVLKMGIIDLDLQGNLAILTPGNGLQHGSCILI